MYEIQNPLNLVPTSEGGDNVAQGFDKIKLEQAVVRDAINAVDAAKETPAGAQSKADAVLVTAKAYTDTKVAALVDSTPATLDTLNELANALGDDPNFATTITNLVCTKAPQSSTYTKTEVNTLLGEKETLAGAQSKADAVQANLTNHINELQDYSFTPKVADIITKGPWVDVRAFGAVGDGITNDSPAVQSAVNSLPNGGTVFFPHGDYVFNTTVKYEKTVNAGGIVFEGIGLKSARILNKVTNGFALEITTKDASFANEIFIYNAKIKNISIVGDEITTNSGGIKMLGCFYAEIKDVAVELHTGDGILVTGNPAINDDLTASQGLLIEGVYSRGNHGWGVNLDNKLTPDRTRIIRSRIIDNKSGGIRAGNHGLTVISCAVANNGLTSNGGILCYTDAGIRNNWLIENNEIDNNYNYNVKILGSTTNMAIRSNRILTNLIGGILQPMKSVVIGDVAGYGAKLTVIENNTFVLNDDISTSGLTHVFIELTTKANNTQVYQNFFNLHANNTPHVTKYLNNGNTSYIMDDAQVNLSNSNLTGFNQIVAKQFNSLPKTTIVDDSVVIFTPVNKTGLVAIVINGSQASSGILVYRAEAGPGLVAIAKGTFSNVDIAVAGTVLTGTTGTDGRITMSVDTVGNFYVENRSGGSITELTITFI